MIGVDVEKLCNLCNQVKPASEFHRKSSAKDGLNSCCKPCAISKAASWKAANPDRAREIKRASDRRNQAVLRERARQEYWRDPEAAREKRRAWVAANREKYLAAVAKWLKDHPERMAEHYHQKRAQRALAPVGDVDLAALPCETCGICGTALDASLRWPDPLSKSLDHKTPLARGGSHEQSNLQWAHLACNVRKGARAA